MATDSIAHIEAVFTKFQQGAKPSAGKDSATVQKAPEWAGFDLDLLEELKQTVASAFKKSPKDAELLKLSARVYYDIDDPSLLFGVLDKWKKADKKSIIPHLYRSEYYFHDERISYDEFIAEIKDALKIDPDSLAVLSMAYSGAKAKGDDGRQLKYACEYASRARSADWQFVYGTLCRQGMMFDRAEREFIKGLAIKPDHPYCTGGLARCYFEMGKLDKAEELFASLTESKVADVSNIAKARLNLIDNIRQKKPVPEKIKRLLKHADEWEKRRVDEISDEQHRKLIAECFARK